MLGYALSERAGDYFATLKKWAYSVLLNEFYINTYCLYPICSLGIKMIDGQFVIAESHFYVRDVQGWCVSSRLT